MEEIKRGASLSSLNESELCHKARSFKRELPSINQGKHYYRAIIMKAAIIAGLQFHPWIKDGVTNQEQLKRDVMEYMSTRYAEIGFMNFQQRQATLLWDHHLVCRYLLSENRPMKFPAGKNVLLGDKEIYVKPDVAYIFGDSIELIWFKNGKMPKKTRKRYSKELDYSLNMQLYAAVLYARSYGFTNIKASYYYLAFSSDTQNWQANRQHFFGSSENIITVSDVYMKDMPNELDAQMHSDIQRMKAGCDPEQIGESACEKCHIKELCKFTMPPVRLGDPVYGGK